MKRKILVVIVGLVAVVFAACGPEPEPLVVADEDVAQEYADKSNISITHKVGTSPCPQELTSVLVNSSSSTEVPDSVVVTKTNTSLDAFFSGSGETTSVKSGGQIDDTLRVFFTCAKAESIDDEITLEYYKNGEVFTTETIKVKVTVEN